jgi:hypothetical protein
VTVKEIVAKLNTESELKTARRRGEKYIVKYEEAGVPTEYAAETVRINPFLETANTAIIYLKRKFEMYETHGEILDFCSL